MQRSAAVLLFVVLGGCGDGGDDVAVAPLDPCTNAYATAADFPPELAAQLDATLAERFEGVAAPGVAVAVVLPGGAGWYGAAGIASVYSDAPLGPSARFRVGSITKTFVAAAALQLAEEGTWNLSDPLDDWVPDWQLGPEVTLERLLSHTAGIYNFTDDGAFLAHAYEDVPPETVIDFALEHDPVGDPGTVYSYSNTDYFLLGLAIEAATGKALEVVLRERLIAPAGLSATYLEHYETSECPIVQGHVAGGTNVTEGFSATWAWAAGGLVSHTGDLCSWAEQLVRGEVLDASSRALMQTVTPLSAAIDPYGLGLMLPVRGGRALAGHTGSTMGFNGELFIDPQSGTCVAVQSNDFVGEPSAVALPIWDVLAAAGQ
jgi:D-alanyl-D-alanine carboxypeptidase